jgi:hypothetical protein
MSTYIVVGLFLLLQVGLVNREADAHYSIQGQLSKNQRSSFMPIR